MSPVVAVYGGSTDRDRARCAAAAAFFGRRAEILGEEAPPHARTAEEVLSELSAHGLLSYETVGEGVEAHYTPSRECLEAVRSAGDAGGFPAPIHNQHLKAFRTRRGAVFSLPAEGGGAALEVFITDWSPCPVAGAVAVHPDHPFLDGLSREAPPSFSGRFVRHPLTGDLLPVWVAGWVKPHFGTGAVLVNPAHDAADLALAREVGLPIRFGLVPDDFDGTPTTWPEPPVVQSGRSIRTGPYDGLTVPEAREAFFEVLAGLGLAREHTDLQAGRWRVATLIPDPEGMLRWDGRTRRLGLAGEGGRVRLADAELLAAAATLESAASAVLVAPAAEQADGLLALRLLHHDLTGRGLAPAAVHLTQRVQGGKADLEPRVEELGLLAGAALDQGVALKQQVVDQVARFLRLHEELAATADGSPSAGGPPSKQLLQARQAVEQGDPAKAFAAVYSLQKQLAGRDESRSGSDLAGYFVVAYVLAGLEPPEGHGARGAWRPRAHGDSATDGARQ